MACNERTTRSHSTKREVVRNHLQSFTTYVRTRKILGRGGGGLSSSPAGASILHFVPRTFEKQGLQTRNREKNASRHLSASIRNSSCWKQTSPIIDKNTLCIQHVVREGRGRGGRGARFIWKLPFISCSVIVTRNNSSNPYTAL